MIFDTHAHYDDKAFDSDRKELFHNMKKEGVEFIVNVGSDLEANRKTLALAEEFPFIYAALGVHPSETGELAEADIQWIKKKAENPKVVAIGEIGLDYHYDNIDKELQKKWFKRQLGLARETGLPVCIHSRDAAQDTLDIMQAANSSEIGGVIHCFSYGWDIAKIYLDMGFYLGIGGVLTFKNSKKLKEVAQKTPLERIVLETDAPYLAPEPYRGKRNVSHYLSYVVDELAAIKGVGREGIMQATWDNAMSLYRIKGQA